MLRGSQSTMGSRRRLFRSTELPWQGTTIRNNDDLRHDMVLITKQRMGGRGRTKNIAGIRQIQSRR